MRTDQIVTKDTPIKAELTNGSMLYGWVMDNDVIGVWVANGEKGRRTLYPWSAIAWLEKCKGDEVREALGIDRPADISDAWAADTDTAL